MCYLFRGVSELLHKKNKGRLVPKRCGQDFKHVFNLSEGLTLGKGAILGRSEVNAVIRHQLKQESFPTSGVSTTPFIERAKFYATTGGKYESGFIYKIDRSLLADNGVIEFNVLDYTDAPCIPEDKEIILVSKDFDILPDTIIAEIFSVKKTFTN